MVEALQPSQSHANAASFARLLRLSLRLPFVLCSRRHSLGRPAVALCLCQRAHFFIRARSRSYFSSTAPPLSPSLWGAAWFKLSLQTSAFLLTRVASADKQFRMRACSGKACRTRIRQCPVGRVRESASPQVCNFCELRPTALSYPLFRE